MTDEPDRPVLCELKERALIRVSGPDAPDFLQGQLSNDVYQVTPAQSQLTSLNTPQGRTLALMRLFEFDGELMLSLPRDLQMSIVERLRKYILRSRVVLEPADGRAGFGIAGKSAATALGQAGITPPVLVNETGTKEGVVAIRVPGHSGDRFELYGDVDPMAAVRTALGDQCDRAEPETWRLLDTLAGIPLLSPETSGEFVAQMLNLDELGAINFKKGCYAGQEVIARAHYRGQVKRRLKLLFRNEPAQPGALLDLHENISAAVVQSAPQPQGGFAVLAVAPV
ncbi:MAG TPA: folate-binding protein [Gammaproteobacteria bacterium]|nr:folate-binding protein [Gammaproteobacteria bacterium]